MSTKVIYPDTPVIDYPCFYVFAYCIECIRLGTTKANEQFMVRISMMMMMTTRTTMNKIIIIMMMMMMMNVGVTGLVIVLLCFDKHPPLLKMG